MVGDNREGSKEIIRRRQNPGVGGGLNPRRKERRCLPGLCNGRLRDGDPCTTAPPRKIFRATYYHFGRYLFEETSRSSSFCEILSFLPGCSVGARCIQPCGMKYVSAHVMMYNITAYP